MEPKVSRSLANFAAKFCNELGTSKTSVCSPLSAEIVLALLALGSRGWARTELLQALDMADDDAIRSSFALLISTLKSVKESTLIMANKIYLQKGAALKPKIKKDAKKVFRSDLEQLDFNEKKAAAGVINQWVARQTNNLITDVVSAETFNEDTCMLLINAIYFRGKFVYPFEKKFTRNREFHVNKETTIKVPQMYMYDIDYFYGCSKELKAKGGEASMVIVLPDEIEGLNIMLEQLAEGYDLMSDIKAMKGTKLNITIPKFKAKITIDLKEVLAKLGIQSIFDKGTSELDMLTSNKRLFVSEAIQMAFIEVDEVGTEAAACTKVREKLMCGRREPITNFTADRPFLYLLTCHEIPIFIGVYTGSEEPRGVPLCETQTKQDSLGQQASPVPPHISRSLLKNWALEKNKTTICSPLSAETVLALLALASRNQTREEQLQALGLPDDEAIRSTFTSLTTSLESVQGVTLTMASKIYLRKEDNLKPEIKKVAEEVFCPRRSSLSIGTTKPSILEQLDFSDGNAAAAMVNEWVSMETNGLIRDMVSAEMFTNNRMLLLNAIYFKGKWERPFHSADYRNFHVNKNTTIQVISMYNSRWSFNYGVSADLKSKLLQLPYNGGEASMVIVLPDDIEGLNTVLQQLAAGHDLMADIEAMKKTEVIIEIPKFKAEMTIDMKELLRKLGIKSIFDKETSEIDMLTPAERLSVSEAVQKAYIEVDEAGTTAAASTIYRRELRAKRNPKFIADRPFLYLLMWHKIPLFIGVYEGSAYAQQR